MIACLRLVLALSALSASSACATTLRLHHGDLTGPPAELLIDDVPVGVAVAGSDLSVDVTRGVHDVDVRAVGGQRRWLRGPWRIFVDSSADLTLLPDEPAAAPGQPR